MKTRSNEEWLAALSGRAENLQADALRDLREYLLRAVLVYLTLQRSELAKWTRQDVRDLAENLSQESLLDIRDNLEKFQGKSKFTTWAYRVAINRAASELRRRRYRNLSLEQLLDEEADAFQAAVAERESVDPDQLAEQRYYLDLLHNLIATGLSERQRAAVVGVYLQGYSMDEVATALGLNRNALYKLLHDARKRIKKQLLANHLTLGDILAAFGE